MRKLDDTLTILHHPSMTVPSSWRFQSTLDVTLVTLFRSPSAGRPTKNVPSSSVVHDPSPTMVLRSYVVTQSERVDP